MTVIEISGEIGWEVTPDDVSEQLKAAKGDDLMVRLSSIGGDIWQGGDIMTLLMNYKRDNKGAKLHLEIGSVAASMATAISSAPIWDSKAIESTTSWMIHNPASFQFGDYRAMDSMSKMLSDWRVVYINLYSNASIYTEKQISKMMDATTWLYGQSIIDAGFADRFVTVEDDGGEMPLFSEETPIQIDEAIIILEMKSKFETMESKMKIREMPFDQNRAVACLKAMPKIKESTPKGNDNIPSLRVGDQETEVPEVETKSDVKKELPSIHNEILNDGVMKERESERARLTALASMKTQEEYKNIPEVIGAIDKAIVEQKTIEETNNLVMAAMVKIVADPNRMSAIESPKDIQGGDMVVEEPKKPVAKKSHMEV